ncbi:MAG: F-type H+/Na+-transporting ATPase subunit alpha, partial [Actinomycetota bacterium]|nr:F-type H+/Na+-transporting ATPase subunit alpha [Actinomycetota bacterium]
NGKLDEVPVEDVLRFERELLDFLGRNSTVLATIRDSNLLDKDSIAELETQVDKFKLEFQTGEGKPLASAGTEQFNQIDAEDITQEQIVVRKKRK